MSAAVSGRRRKTGGVHPLSGVLRSNSVPEMAGGKVLPMDSSEKGRRRPDHPYRHVVWAPMPCTWLRGTSPCPA